MRIFPRWFGRRQAPLTPPAGELHFLCEHDGPPEQELKRKLSAVFEIRPDVEAAYLAMVANGSNRGVALCVTGVADPGRLEIVKAVGTVFATLFSAQQHLDIVFPTDSQIVQLGRVCRPFYVRAH